MPFALGGLGGGDVKLLGALGAWLGVTNVVWLALYTGVAGGVLALVVALWRGLSRAGGDERLPAVDALARSTACRPLAEASRSITAGDRGSPTPCRFLPERW